MIGMIAAVSKNGVIGKDGSIPFHYPADMKFFKEKTLNSVVVMGRATYESIGKPLPKRKNIVITRTDLNIPGVECYTSLEDAIQYGHDGYENLWLIGGARIYQEGMQYADEIFLTITPDMIEGEGLVRFPWINSRMFKVSEWVNPADWRLYVAHYERFFSASKDI